MRILKSLFGCFLLTIPFCVTAQRNCNFQIDTLKIRLSENLDTFVLKLQTEKFTTYNNKDAIPKSVKETLDCLTKKFSIANPNQEYACCCTSSDRLPRRKLIFLSKSKDMLVMTYLTGGFATSTHLLFVQFDDEKIIDLWTSYCPENFKSNKDIIKFAKQIRDKGIINTYLVYL